MMTRGGFLKSLAVLPLAGATLVGAEAMEPKREMVVYSAGICDGAVDPEQVRAIYEKFHQFGMIA